MNPHPILAPRWRIDRLRVVANRLHDASEKYLPLGAERIGAGELRDAAHDIMQVVILLTEKEKVGDEDVVAAPGGADVVVALENVQAAVEGLRTQVERLQSIVQLGFRLEEAGRKLGMTGEEAKLYSVEPSHLAGLRSVAARLSVVANTRDTMGEEELRNMALIIMQAVRFAEVLEAMRRPGVNPPAVLCELPRKEGE